MTEKIFWNNPYKTELSSKVTNIDGNKVELNQTIFYAEAGGQESDKGTINDIPVLVATPNGSRIEYTLESQPNFKVGDTVVIAIDWERRYSLMRLHFAAEVVLEVFNRFCSGIVRIGSHISQSKSRIDFE